MNSTINFTNVLDRTIGGKTNVSNGRNVNNDINFVGGAGFSTLLGDVSVANGAGSTSNSIDVDGATMGTNTTNNRTTTTFTNGTGPTNAINLGVTNTNTSNGQVFASNNSAAASVGSGNTITIPQGVFNRNVTLSNGLNSPAAVVNLITLATLGSGVDVTGNLVASTANTTGSNTVNIGGAAVGATNGLRVVQVTPANGSGSGNVNISNGTTSTGAASVSILGGAGAAARNGSTNEIDGDLSVINKGSTGGGTKNINLSGLATFGRTGATLNNNAAGNSVTNIGGNAGAVTTAVFFNGTGGLFVQDGSGSSLFNLQLATIGTLGTARQIGLRYQDLGGGNDTINVSTLGTSSVTVNGPTNLQTLGGDDVITITRSVASGGGGSAAFNDSVFTSLGDGNDILNIGAFAASPALGSASKFQFDGGKGVNTINASPLSVSKYTVGKVPAKLKSKITGFTGINGAPL